jgi:hypothetical protein
MFRYSAQTDARYTYPVRRIAKSWRTADERFFFQLQNACNVLRATEVIGSSFWKAIWNISRLAINIIVVITKFWRSKIRFTTASLISIPIVCSRKSSWTYNEHSKNDTVEVTLRYQLTHDAHNSVNEVLHVAVMSVYSHLIQNEQDLNKRNVLPIGSVYTIRATLWKYGLFTLLKVVTRAAVDSLRAGWRFRG